MVLARSLFADFLEVGHHGSRTSTHLHRCSRWGYRGRRQASRRSLDRERKVLVKAGQRERHRVHDQMIEPRAEDALVAGGVGPTGPQGVTGNVGSTGATGRSTSDYSGAPTYIDNLWDVAPTSTSGGDTFFVTRAVTSADLSASTAPSDILHTGSSAITNPDGSRSNIGVAGGPYAWP